MKKNSIAVLLVSLIVLFFGDFVTEMIWPCSPYPQTLPCNMLPNGILFGSALIIGFICFVYLVVMFFKSRK